MNHKGTVVLETKRLILRRYSLDDTDDMFNNWATNENVTKFLPWTPYTSKEDLQAYISMCIESYEKPSTYNWIIEFKENRQAIGSISVTNVNEDIDEAEVGYCLGEDYWHKGIMTEAFSRVIEFLFDEVNVNKVSASHDVNNPNSGKVMKKCGLIYEGTKKQGARNNTGLCDDAIYGLVKSDYLAKREIFKNKL